MSAAAIGDLAGAQNIVLHELSPQDASLEEAYLDLTRDSVEYQADGREGGLTCRSRPTC